MNAIRYAAAAIVGLVVGSIVAANIVIFSGVQDGYEASISDVFDHSVPVGLLVVVALAAGPIGAVVFLRRSMARR